VKEQRYYFNGKTPFTKIDEHRTGHKSNIADFDSIW